MLATPPTLEIQPVFDPNLSPGEILEIRASSLNRLSTLLRLVEGAWAMAVYGSGTIREQMEESLIGKIAPVRLQTIPLVGRTPDPLAFMQGESDAPVLSLHGFGNRMADFCGYLDVQRESLARHPHRLLLWVSAYEQRILAQQAPNFYSRLSGIFYFPGGAAISAGAARPTNGTAARTLAQGEVAALTAPAAFSGGRRRPYLPVADSQDRQAQTDFQHQRIHSLRQQRRPDTESIGDGWYDLAGLYETDLPNRWAEAEAAYSEAARAYAQAGKTLAEAEARYQAGDAAMRAYAHPAALAHFDNALGLYRLYTETPDERVARLGEANVLKAQGDVLSFQDKRDEALGKYERALALFQAVGDRLGEANVLKAQGDVLYFLKKTDEALGKYERALALFQAVGDRLGEANVLKAQGDVLSFQDKRDEALGKYERALALFQAVGDRLGEANVLKAQGDVLSFQDKRDEALGKYERALALFQAVGDRLGEANVLKAQGDVLYFLKKTDEALGKYERALALFQAVGDRLGEANVLKAQGDVLYFLKKTDEALGKYERALALFQAVGDRLGEANVLKAQGEVALQNGEEERGFGLLEQARQLYALTGAQSGLANIGIRLGRYAAAQGNFAYAIECMQPAADFCKAIGHPLGEQLQAQIDGWRAQTPS